MTNPRSRVLTPKERPIHPFSSPGETDLTSQSDKCNSSSLPIGPRVVSGAHRQQNAGSQDVSLPVEKHLSSGSEP